MFGLGNDLVLGIRCVGLEIGRCWTEDLEVSVARGLTLVRAFVQGGGVCGWPRVGLGQGVV